MTSDNQALRDDQRQDHGSEHSTSSPNCQCFHCGDPVPKGVDFAVQINGELQPMCCPGCQAVAIAIVDGGLTRFYQHRDNWSPTGNNGEIQGDTRQLLQEQLAVYDDPASLDEFSQHDDDGSRDITLALDGVTCAACTWLIEQHLKPLDGVDDIQVNYSTHRCQLRWQPQTTKLSDLLLAIHDIGYQAQPFNPDQQDANIDRENRTALIRLGLAGVGMMQVGMYAIALYAGALQGIEPGMQQLLRWVSLVIATPVVLLAAAPFFQGLWRDLHNRRPSMDTPIAIAIGCAYSASLVATVQGIGEVYFDSVVMFTFFLLIARYLEMRARHQHQRAANLQSWLPHSSRRRDFNTVSGGKTEWQDRMVPVSQLKVDDVLALRPGEVIPADGVLYQCQGHVNEAALTGEFYPVAKIEGDAVSAGTLVAEQPLLIQISAVGRQSRLWSIMRMLEKAAQGKPPVARLADQVAGYFVVLVLLLTGLTGAYWWFTEPSDAFWIALAVLVVSCPCALSLATPTAITSAIGHLRQRGVIVSKSHWLEGLAKTQQVVFDKTGTLTEGHLTIEQIVPLAKHKPEQLLQWAASLEQQVSHPIADAFRRMAQQQQLPLIEAEVNISTGAGVSGCLSVAIDGQTKTLELKLGHPQFVLASEASLSPPDNDGHWLLLGSQEAGPLGWFLIDDSVRDSAKACVQRLQQMGICVHLLSGDRSADVRQVAKQLGIKEVVSGASPEQKVAYVRQLEQQDNGVLMVGDGINDAPVLAGSQLSLAMTGASDLSKASADAVLLSPDLNQLCNAIDTAKRCRRTIQQNLGWALTYNISAIPLAACGWIPPYLAAAGMSLSSLVVVLNSAKQHRRQKPQNNSAASSPSASLT